MLKTETSPAAGKARMRVEQADTVGEIDFQQWSNDGFDLVALTSHNGKLVAVIRHLPGAQQTVNRGGARPASMAI